MDWDLFVSHSSDDKDEIARPLANALSAIGYRVWFDEFELTIGSPLRGKIDEGLAKSHFGVVVLSPSFLAKNWTRSELDALFSRDDYDHPRLLPVWHKVEACDISAVSPLLAARLAVNTDRGIMFVRDKIAAAVMKSGLDIAFQRVSALVEEGDLDRLRACLDAHIYRDTSDRLTPGDAMMPTSTLARPQIEGWTGVVPDYVVSRFQPSAGAFCIDFVFLGPINADGAMRDRFIDECRGLFSMIEEVQGRAAAGMRPSPCVAKVFVGRRSSLPQYQSMDRWRWRVHSYDRLIEESSRPTEHGTLPSSNRPITIPQLLRLQAATDWRRRRAMDYPR